MKRREITVTVVICKCLFNVLCFMLFVLLLLLGRVLRPIASLAMSGGTMLFLFCLFIRPDMTTPMWAGAALAIAATASLVLYEMALQLVAPAGVEIITEI